MENDISSKINQAKTLLEECLSLLGQTGDPKATGSPGTGNHPVKSDKEKYSGPKGGVIWLIDNDFFNKKRTVSQVKDELEQNGYIYQRSVLQTALNRLSVKTGPLTSMKDGDIKIYAIRK